MIASFDDKSDESQRFLQAIHCKDEITALTSIRALIAGKQMLLPGFMPADRDGGNAAKKTIKRAASQLNIPKNILQMALGRCPDYFQIIKALISKEPSDSLQKLEPEIFRPVRPARPLRYNDPATAWDQTNGGKWIVQYKMDGWYCQIHAKGDQAHLYSRNGNSISIASLVVKTIPEITGNNNVILECELIGIDPLGNIAPLKDIRENSNSIRAYFFDLLYFNGDLTRKPYLERYNLLKELLSTADQSILTIVESDGIESRGEFIDRFEDWNGKKGLEGMIARRPDAIYEADCSTKNFLKIKIHETIDAVVLGYTDFPRSYLVGVLDEAEDEIVPFAWITIPTLQSDPIAAEIKPFVTDLPALLVGARKTDYRTKPELVVEVEGDKICKNNNYPCGKVQTGAGWSLQQARISRIRTDKSLSDATTVEAFLRLDRVAGDNTK